MSWPLSLRTLAIEKLLADHSSAVAKFDMLSFSDGVRMPELMYG